MSSALKQDICFFRLPGELAITVDSGLVEQYLPSEVQYACLYWVQHLQKGGVKLIDNDQVHEFLNEHLLHWLEALGWMRGFLMEFSQLFNSSLSLVHKKVTKTDDHHPKTQGIQR